MESNYSEQRQREMDLMDDVHSMLYRGRDKRIKEKEAKRIIWNNNFKNIIDILKIICLIIITFFTVYASLKNK